MKTEVTIAITIESEDDDTYELKCDEVEDALKDITDVDVVTFGIGQEV